MFKKTIFAGLILAAALFPSWATAYIRGGLGVAATLSFTAQWQPLPIGAGGQITAVYNYSDGTTLARSDNYGAWLYSASSSCTYGAAVYVAPCWNQLITATSIPSFTIDLTFKEGAVELVAAPSNTNTLYMLWNGGLWVSTNKGANWVQCSNFLGTSQTANNGNASGPFIAVDPNDPNTVFVDALGHGLYRSTNGTSGATATFAQVATVGTTTEHVIAFQPGSSSHVVVWTQGTGAFESTNGTTFAAITTGSPPSSAIQDPHITSDKFNQFWIWDSKASTANVYRWASSTWSAIATGVTGNGSAAAFAVDPNSASVLTNHLAVSSYTGQLAISSNNGANWSTQLTNETISVGASQPTWIGVANQNQGTGSYLLNGYSIAFDQSSNLFLAGGLGLWQTNAPITGSATVWNLNTLGIEQLVTTQIISPPGYAPIMGAWDKGFFLSKVPGIFPTVNWDNNTSLNAIIGGWAVDWASADPTFITGWAVSNISADVAPASSADGGNTWILWGTVPSHPGSGVGGAIAALDSQHWILQPSTGNAMLFTANGGGSWATSTISGTPTNWNASAVGLPFAADRVTAGVFCAVTGGQVFYSSTNSGSSFTATGLTSASVDGGANSFSFKSMPTVAGTFFYTAGEQGGSHPTNTHLWKITKTTIPCDTSTNVNANLKEVMAFGFGAHRPGAGGTFPTIYADAWFNGVQGFFQSVDGGTTWAAINVPANQIPWALNSSDFPKDLEGDMDVYGRIYLAQAQSASAFIDTADACPWVGFSNVNPNASLTGAAVTVTATHSGLVPVTGVNFYVDGVQIGTTQTGQTTYSVSFNASAQSVGAHTLKVQSAGNGCTIGGTGNFKSIPITTH